MYDICLYLCTMKMQEIDRIIDVICEEFDITRQMMMGRNTSSKVSIARNFAYYILHCDCNVSVYKIAKIFSRTPRNVFQRIANIRYNINKVSSYCNKYKKIQSFLSE